MVPPQTKPIPADIMRHPWGCPDPEWCRGKRACYWACEHGDDMEVPVMNPIAIRNGVIIALPIWAAIFTGLWWVMK